MKPDSTIIAELKAANMALQTENTELKAQHLKLQQDQLWHLKGFSQP